MIAKKVSLAEAYRLAHLSGHLYYEYEKRQLESDVVLFYWPCKQNKHAHPTEDSAATCDIKCLKKLNKLKAKPNIHWSNEMLLEIKRQRDSGMTYKAIMETYGLSIQRGRQLVARAERLHKRNLGRTARAISGLIESYYANNP